MKAVFFEMQGSLDNLQVGDFPEPTMKPDECLIRVHAAALNGFEPMMIIGGTSLKTPLPMIPCGDVAGEVIEIGKDVPSGQWNIGDRVIINPYSDKGMMGETVRGGACEHVSTNHQQLIRIPDGVSYADAACTIIAYGTAHRMIGSRGQVCSTDTVLVLGATGGVGVAAVQFAKRAGAKVIACGSSDWKVEKLKEIGADAVIDTNTTDFYEWIKDNYGKPTVFGTGGVNVVINYIGGETWVKSLRCLGKGGRLLTCGATAGYAPATDIRFIWSYELAILGSDGWDENGPAEILDMMAAGELKPVIHATCPLADAPAMLKLQYDRKIFGKVVFTPVENS